jgi:hypothetical protein
MIQRPNREGHDFGRALNANVVDRLQPLRSSQPLVILRSRFLSTRTSASPQHCLCVSKSAARAA